MTSNPCHGNSSNVRPNFYQVQPQNGVMNPQVSAPFYNSNIHPSNGHAMGLGIMPPTATPPTFMNVPNHLIPLQNNHMYVQQQLGPAGPVPHLGQCHVGMGPQNGAYNLNTLATFPVSGPFCNLAQNVNQINPSQHPQQFSAHNPPNLNLTQNMNQVNPSQPPQQFSAHNPPNINLAQNMNQVNPSHLPQQFSALNSPNFPQQFSQNFGVPNGQFSLQNPMNNMNQFVHLQMSNPNQVGSYNIPICSQPMLGGSNQVPQTMGTQNPSFIPNPQFGLVPNGVGLQHLNQNQQQFVQTSVDLNESKQYPNATQNLQGNSSMPCISHSVQHQQTQKSVQHQQAQNIMQSSLSMRSQGSDVKDGGNKISHTNLQNSLSNNFTRNPNREASHWGSQKSKFHHAKNTKRKFLGYDQNGRKGFSNGKTGKVVLANSTDRGMPPPKRSLSLNYTEQEIQQWVEARKKNYPSEANIKKMQTDTEIINREVKLRREQLKEILAKQAELGIEVAEIPPQYLQDSEKQVDGRNDNKKGWMTRKERFQNKRKNRRRDRFDKKQKFVADKVQQPCLIPRDPTLLQKLLSGDIKRDNHRLLQIFRFMVSNSFFKDWPEEPLKFPLVLVKESGSGSRVVEEIEKGSVVDNLVEENEEGEILD